MKQKNSNFLRSLKIAIAVFLALVIYAYGFQVTNVKLEETKSEHRQTQLVRILRALAKPDILEYEREEFIVLLPIMVPCPEGDNSLDAPNTSNPYLVMTPSCADPREVVMIEGHTFESFSTGPLNFLPADSTVRLQLGTFKADKNGDFEMEVRLSPRPNEKIQEIQAITRKNIGTPKFTETALATWEKIIETVFMALLATTLGTMIAIPLSFFAARNLMEDVTSTLIGSSLSILFIPVGAYLGIKVAGLASQLSTYLTGNLLYSLAGLIIISLIIWQGVRFAFPQQEIEKISSSTIIGRTTIKGGLFLLLIMTLYLVSNIALGIGTYLAINLGSFAFLGDFVRDMGDILNLVIVIISALTIGAVFSSIAGRLGIKFGRTPKATTKIIKIVLAILAGAMLFILIMAMLNWFYEYNNYTELYAYAGIIGSLMGLVLGITLKPTAALKTGFIIYYIFRTVFNALRSIEAIVWAIIFVVWVGIGPFAGSLALALHTIAALAKLYSEQVESIMAGPVEAIQSTGANRLQTIIYGVIPQIVPPYISFTMYRWDINVRMSTIIGFAGGGGIGFLLSQNINLLQYRAASVQMFAIAIVVASMDYISSKLRENVV